MHNPFSSKKLNQDWLDKIAEETEFTADAPELARCDFHNLFVIDDMQRGRKYHKILSEGNATLVATAFTEAQFHCWKRTPDGPETVAIQNTTNIVTGPEEVFTVKEGKKTSLGFAYDLSPPVRKRELPPAPPINVSESLIIALPKQDQLTTTEWVEANRHRNRYDHWAKIKGELWKVPSNHFYSLDKFMGNGRVFRRSRVLLEVPLKMLYRNGAHTHIERIIPNQEAYMYVGIKEFWEPQLDGGYYFQPMTIFNNSSLNRKYYCYTKLED